MLRRLLRMAVLTLWMPVFAGAESVPMAEKAEKVLIPIFLKGEVPGSHGSSWTSRLVITNRSDQPAGVGGILFGPGCPFDPCEEPLLLQLPEATTIFARPSVAVVGSFPPTSFVLIEENRWRDLAFSLRIQDLSRQAMTWGTEIPVIHEADALSGPADLLDVPAEPRFRVLLRVYDFEPDAGHRVRISGFEIDPTVVWPPAGPQSVDELFSVERELTVYQDPIRGYAQLDLAEVTTRFPLVERLRVRVEPLAEGMRFWTFISVTNNETQHVTTITPR